MYIGEPWGNIFEIIIAHLYSYTNKIIYIYIFKDTVCFPLIYVSQRLISCTIFHFFYSQLFCWINTINLSVMSDPSSNSYSKYNHIFSWKFLSPGKNKKLCYISYIWEYVYIKRLKNNTWKCIWCDINLQRINDTKYLAHILRTRGMHIKVFWYYQ